VERDNSDIFWRQKAASCDLLGAMNFQVQFLPIFELGLA
jgi:hypothetical protein